MARSDASGTRARSTWAPLQNRNFVTLLAGRNLSNWGDAIFSIALVWFVYRATHSVLDTAVLSAVQRLAIVLAGPVAGVFVDRWDRRRSMMAVDVIDMVVVLILAALAMRHVLGLAPIYAAVLIMAAVQMLVGPAFHSVMSRILPREDLAGGNGLYRSVGSANGFFAQAVGGGIVAAVGAVASLFIDAGSFLFSIAALWMIRIPPDPPINRGAAPRRRFWAELKDGWQAVRAHRVFPPLLLWLFTATAGGGAVIALMPVVVFQQLHGGPATLGIVEGAAVAGSVGGGLATAWLSRSLSMGVLLVGCGGLMGLSYGAFGVSHVLWLSLTVMIAAGFSQTAMNSAFNAFFQSSVPAELMGRTFGILGAVEGATGPLSALAGGPLGSAVGAGPVLAAGGAWLAMSGLILLRSRSLMTNRAVEEATD